MASDYTVGDLVAEFLAAAILLMRRRSLSGRAASDVR